MQKRTLIGLSALFLLAVGCVVTISGASGAMAAEGQSSSLKLGVICSLIWLAYPELIKLPSWLFPAMFCTALAAYRWRWLFAFVPIIAAVCWLLKPRRKNLSVSSRRPRREPSQPRDA
jgi:hypothetical protein